MLNEKLMGHLTTAEKAYNEETGNISGLAAGGEVYTFVILLINNF